MVLTQTSSQWAVGKYLWFGVWEIWPDWEDEETEVWGKTFSWQKSTNWHEYFTIYVFNCRLKSSSTESSTLRNCESISTNTNVHIKLFFMPLPLFSEWTIWIATCVIAAKKSTARGKLEDVGSEEWCRRFRADCSNFLQCSPFNWCTVQWDVKVAHWLCICYNITM